MQQAAFMACSKKIFKGVLRQFSSIPVKSTMNERTLEYIYRIGIRNSPLKEELLEETKRLYPEDYDMSTDRIQGDFIENLVESMNAKKCLEVGVFTGFSSLCTAFGLPDDGKIYALDVSEEYTSVARKYWKKAGVEHKIDLILDPALETLTKFRREGHDGTFDYAFIDADKPNYINYYELVVPLMRKGGLILIDNAIFFNEVADETNTHPWPVGIRKVNERVARDDRVKSILLPFGDGIFMVTKK